jgi:hypothetical protein
MAFANTLLGRKRAMTSESGSDTAGLLITNLGLFIVVRPAGGGYCSSRSEITYQEKRS